ncbi:hypothetical protein [Nocardioides islandensis]|uniref:hypothetical protein n=1 Tax=Nocardioides islandensis TaxID=433663 RepID=UPI001E54DF3E|nr:hypothetical protein [Nocardioides islandensis]
MSTNNHEYRRDLQQDARAWARFTDTNYTAALRQMTSPLAQGFLGARVGARDLIAVLEDHPLVGADDDGPLLSDNGFYADEPWVFNGKTDYIELAMIIDMLRMFTPTPPGEEPEVSSYTLKHTAESFLAPHCTYVSNGRMIWAAAALDLPMVEPDGGSLNLLIGVAEREHDYVSRTVRDGHRRPQAHHFRPEAFIYLTSALDCAAAGEFIDSRWVQRTPVREAAHFHDWLVLQSSRNDPIGDFAVDYTAGVHDSDHRAARTPDELLSILYDVSHSPEAYDAAVRAIADWMSTSPLAAPIRTDRLRSDSHDVAGWGAGAGTVERDEFRCPCGDGAIIEEHENVPGFREHNVWLDCDKCRAEWRFVDGRSARQWGLVPATA